MTKVERKRVERPIVLLWIVSVYTEQYTIHTYMQCVLAPKHQNAGGGGDSAPKISFLGGYGTPCPPPLPRSAAYAQVEVNMVSFSSNYRTWYIMSNCTRSQYLGYVHTTYRKAFRADSECASGILWTVTAQNWNKSFTNINQTAPKWGTEPFRYVTLHFRDQQRSFAPLQKQRQKSVADPGEGPGGPGPPYFYTKLRPDGPKKIFLRLSPPLI